MRLFDKIFGNRICFVADGTSGGGATSTSGSATGSASSEATASGSASASATGEATTSASGEANAEAYVSPFTIVYRKDLNRPLTSDEVDNNFAQIDNMYRMLLKAETDIKNEIKTTATELENKISDAVLKAKSYTSELESRINDKLRAIESSTNNIANNVNNLKETQNSLLETKSKFDMAFGQFFEKDKSGDEVFNTTKFGNAIKSIILQNLDDSDISVIKAKVGVSALEERVNQDEIRLTKIEGRTATNEEAINMIKNAISPFMVSDGSAIDIEKLANALVSILDKRYTLKQESTSGEATASENGTASENSDSATASGSGSANGEG